MDWARRGDVNAFFGLMLDNIGDMILMAEPARGRLRVSAEFVLTRMIPGTAVGVMVGDLIFTAMAFRLARRTGRSDVTAMPLGLDTPSTFGAVFLIIGPGVRRARGRGLAPMAAAEHAWFLGHRDDPGLGALQAGLRSVSAGWSGGCAAGGAARVADGDRAGDHQLPAAARHRGDSRSRGWWPWRSSWRR